MSKAARKILAKMRRTVAGWKASDFRALYTGFGFREVQGKKHTQYEHSGTNQWVTVTRASGEISECYAKDAIIAIERVLAFEAERADNE